jgi:putative redox protein
VEGTVEAVEAEVTWLTRMTFDAQVDGHHFTMDSRGPSGDDRAPSPMRYLLASVAGCTAMDVVSVLLKMRQPLTGLVVRVRGEQAPDDPHRYTRVELVYQIRGRGVDRAAAERAVQLSDQKYCSVSATLRAEVPVTTRIELVDESGEAPA